MIGFISKIGLKKNCKPFQNKKNSLASETSVKCSNIKRFEEQKKIEMSSEFENEPPLHVIAEKLNCLLSPNEKYQMQHRGLHKGHLESTLNIAMIFCKPLLDGKLSVESSRRISTAFIQMKYDKIKPDVIVFLGSNRSKGEVGSASAGYVFFRHLSSEFNFNTNNFKMIIQENSDDTRGNIFNLVKDLENFYGKECTSKAHYTLISSDYHLIRISEIHKHSPRQSVLSPLAKNESTWTYLFAAYPFCVSPDPTLAFLGRIRVLANELSIVLVNLNGYANSNELFARENFSRLCEINKKLRTMLRIMFDNRQRPDYNGSVLEITTKQWEILEQCLSNLHEVQTVLTPLFKGESVDRRVLQKAQEVFVNSIKTIKIAVDPDRPLETGEWQLQKRN